MFQRVRIAGRVLPRNFAEGMSVSAALGSGLLSLNPPSSLLAGSGINGFAILESDRRRIHKYYLFYK